MESRVFLLYMVSNKTNGKCYVGWTSQKPWARWSSHCSDARRDSAIYFHKALRKYGRDGFEWNVVKTFATIDEAKQAERDWIRTLKEWGYQLYNLTEGGDGNAGRKNTEEQSKKQSERQKGRKISEEGKRNISLAQTGRKLPKKWRHNISKAKMGDKNPNWGKTDSEETRQKKIKATTGENNVRALLNEQDVIVIIDMLAQGMSNVAIAKIYSVSVCTISAIKQGRNWKHIPRK